MSFCGTAEYLAPEMVEKEGHDAGIDWWALGILIYEMIVGIPPFYHKDRERMFRMITTKPVKYPDMKWHGIFVSDEAKDLINWLLEKDPEARLGATDGLDEIIQHKFFRSIDVQALMDKTMEPTYIPDPMPKFDVSQFDKDVTKLSAKESVISDCTKKKIEGLKVRSCIFSFCFYYFRL